jgi:predicted acylesterase/phospholipase RssA
LKNYKARYLNWSNGARKIFSRVYFSFPIQLVVLLIKKNQILLIYWVVLFGITTESIAVKWGIPYLFLDPEYLGTVGFWSFFMVGVSCGAFIMMFNISSYILNGFRFPFIATLSRPFVKYSINNFIVPLTFLITYIYKVILFQLHSEYLNSGLVALQVSGFLFGLVLIIVVIFTYFFSTNKDIYKMYGITISDDIEALPKKRTINKTSLNWKNGLIGKKRSGSKDWYVETYLSSFFKAKLVRGTEHYDKEMISAVFKQNHFYAAILEVLVFAILLALGFFRDFRMFIIPAGASLMLLFSMFIMLSSALRFWLRGWATVVFVSIFIVANFLSEFSFFNRRNHAYGIDYSTKPAFFNLFRIKMLNSEQNYNQDYLSTLKILERWKEKNTHGNQDKPKIVLISASGGGQRAALWTFRTIQYIDRVTNGELMKHTQFISGSSGGAIGAAYYRQLNYQNQNKEIENSYLDKYVSNISKDMLNPIAFSITANDIFLNIQKVNDGKYSYFKDRAYAFEKQLNINTDNILDKPLSYYKKPEENSQIPMLVLCPTIINDGRRLVISAQHVSYLTQSTPNINIPNQSLIDGVEFTRFFEEQNPLNLKFTSALRMSASFPYISPSVSLPSTPVMEVMDAGIRDNLGIKTTIKFLYVFRKWIKENTGGVILLQIRDTRKELPVENIPEHSLFQNITLPLGSIYGNIAKTQDYNHEELIQYASAWFDGQVDLVDFELPNEKERVSLSWHLTTREKKFIDNAIFLQENQLAMFKLKKLLGLLKE